MCDRRFRFIVGRARDNGHRTLQSWAIERMTRGSDCRETDVGWLTAAKL